MWLGRIPDRDSGLGEARKKTHQIVSDPSQNWYAIHPHVSKPKSNLKFSLGSKNNFTVENRSEIEP